MTSLSENLVRNKIAGTGEIILGEIKDVKVLIICILVADILGGLIYGAKGNVVGIFNCISWAVVSGFILLNFNKIFSK